MIKKIGTLTLTTLILSSTVLTVNAETAVQDGTLQSQVTAQIASSWVVTVPDSIELAGKTGTYSVTIGGDVADSTSITVVPQSTFTLTNGVTQVTAKVEQENQQWLGSSIEPGGTTETGTITIEGDMSAGTWTGALDFQVNCAENLGNLMEKVAMMKNLDIYTLGDSIIDGFTSWETSFYGTAEALNNLYGVKSFKEYAVSGATLTEVSTWFPNVTQQIQAAYSRITGNKEGYNSNTVIIMDGGVNDIMLEKDTPDDYNITINNWTDDKASGHYDVSASLSYLCYYIDNVLGTDVNAPFIYVIPRCDAANAELDILKACIVHLQDTHPDLIVIDCRDFITDADTEDFIHLNASGQTKLAHKIVDALYDYYNN